jgi:shikimate 5-dehydrogenase
MLVHQAAAAWELWMGRSAPLDLMRSAARAALVGR